MRAVEAPKAMLIYREITPWAKQVGDTKIRVIINSHQCISKLKITLELWKEQELLINIMKHSYVPPHTVLTEDQKLDLLRR